MHHLSMVLYPRHAGLHPFHVRFSLPESALVRSMLDDGFRYRHPAREQEAIVWAQDSHGVDAVLTYHYGTQWHGLVLLSDERRP